MALSDVAMVAADSSRTRAYLYALARHDLLPAHVVVLENRTAELLPGQADDKVAAESEVARGVVDEALAKAPPSAKDDCWSEVRFDMTRPLHGLLDALGVPWTAAPDKNINAPDVVAMIAARPESVFIYSGYGGVLLRADVLSAGKRFLHVHGGYLPDFKGSTTNYYSLLDEGQMGASAIFLTAEIDSGPILSRRRFPAPERRGEIDHVYDSAARAKVLVDTLAARAPTGDWRPELDNSAEGDTYYIIHPVLKHLAILGGGGDA